MVENCDSIKVSFTQSTIYIMIKFCCKQHRMEKGDRIIHRGNHEHYANYVPWLYIDKRKKLNIKILKIDQNRFFDINELEIS